MRKLIVKCTAVLYQNNEVRDVKTCRIRARHDEHGVTSISQCGGMFGGAHEYVAPDGKLRAADSSSIKLRVATSS